MKNPQDVVRHIMLSEKGTAMTERDNQYVFKVDRAANKVEIKQAVEQIFKVKVLNVNTMNRQGKKKRLRTQKYGRTSNWKRAVVTLGKGDSIDLT